MTSVDVRPIAADDEADFRRLFHAYGVFYEHDLPAAVIDHVWSSVLEGHDLHGLVASSDGVVVGIGIYRTHVATFTVGRDWYLEDLFVDESTRGNGVGTAIIQHLIQLARATSHGTLKWTTAQSNGRAQRVYDRLAKRTDWVTYEVEL